MALVQLGPNKYDIATPAEVRQILIAQARDREKVRGIKDLRKAVQLTTAAQTRNTLADGIAVEAGYKWVVDLISVSLAAGGIGAASITSDPSSSPGGTSQIAVASVFLTSAISQASYLPKGACVLNEGEGLYLSFSTNITGYMIAGWHVPAERIGELA